MRRFFIVVTIAMILIIPSAIVLAGGPSNKAFGSLYLLDLYDRDIHHRVSLNAREIDDDMHGSGHMIHTIFGPDNKIEQILEYDIVYVVIDSDGGIELGAICKYDSLDSETGKWIYVLATDNEHSTDDFHMLWGLNENGVLWYFTNPVLVADDYRVLSGNIKVLP